MKNRRAHKVWKKTQGMRRNLGHKGCGRSDGTVLLLPYQKSGPLKLHQQCGYQQRDGQSTNEVDPSMNVWIDHTIQQ